MYFIISNLTVIKYLVVSLFSRFTFKSFHLKSGINLFHCFRQREKQESE